jgi:hypothetical protein
MLQLVHSVLAELLAQLAHVCLSQAADLLIVVRALGLEHCEMASSISVSGITRGCCLLFASGKWSTQFARLQLWPTAHDILQEVIDGDAAIVFLVLVQHRGAEDVGRAESLERTPHTVRPRP